MSTVPAQDGLVLIAQDLLNHPLDETTPSRVVDLALEHVPGCDLASITVRARGQEAVTPAASEPEAALLDHWQHAFGDGPGVHALAEGSVSLADDLAAETRWPRWSPRAAELGITSVLCLRLETPDRVLGSLNLYGRRVDAFSDDSIDIGAAYARMASTVLFAAEQTSGLRTALESRNTIGIAQGLLMNRYGLTRNQSFEVLRRRSQETHTKLRDLAAAVVEHWDSLPEKDPLQHL